MEYYLLKQSSNVINPIKILNMDSSIYTTQMTHKDFRQLDKVKVAYIQYEATQEIPDILTQPTYMVSDVIRKVMKMYDDRISFKAIQVYPDKKKDIEAAARTYWIYDCVMEDCLHRDTVIYPNGAVNEIILDQHKIKGRDIFRIKGIVENKTIISLAVAESILRRNTFGVGIERVQVK